MLVKKARSIKYMHSLLKKKKKYPYNKKQKYQQEGELTIKLNCSSLHETKILVQNILRDLFLIKKINFILLFSLCINI